MNASGRQTCPFTAFIRDDQPSVQGCQTADRSKTHVLCNVFWPTATQVTHIWYLLDYLIELKQTVTTPPRKILHVARTLGFHRFRQTSVNPNILIIIVSLHFERAHWWRMTRWDGHSSLLLSMSWCGSVYRRKSSCCLRFSSRETLVNINRQNLSETTAARNSNQWFSIHSHYRHGTNITILIKVP